MPITGTSPSPTLRITVPRRIEASPEEVFDAWAPSIVDVELYFVADMRQGAKVLRDCNSNHHCCPFPPVLGALRNSSHAFSIAPFLVQA